MRKVFVIAGREYRAAVRSKAFLVTLVLMPVLMGASAGVQVLFKKFEDTTEKKYAVVDRSPGGKIADALTADVATYNSVLITDSKTGERIHPAMSLEVVPPSPSDPEAVKRQRFELSKRVESGELEAVVEIGPDVYSVRADPVPDNAPVAPVVRCARQN